MQFEIFKKFCFQKATEQNNQEITNHIDTGRKLNVHKTFRRRTGHLPNALCTFILRLVSTGKLGFLMQTCRKNSSISLSTHFSYNWVGRVGLLRSAQCIKHFSTCIFSERGSILMGFNVPWLILFVSTIVFNDPSMPMCLALSVASTCKIHYQSNLKFSNTYKKYYCKYAHINLSELCQHLLHKSQQ